MNNTSKTTSRAAKKIEAPVQLNMQATVGDIDLTSDDALLASMLEDIGDDAHVTVTAEPPLAVEPEEMSAAPVVTADIIDIGDEAAIEAAVAEIEKAETLQGHYEGEGDGYAAPTEPAVDAAPAKKEKKAKEPKEPKAPRITYVGNKASEVLKAKLGDKTGEMLILELEDASLEPSALEAKQAELLALLNRRPGSDEGSATQKKVAEKIVMLFGWLKTGGTLNKVMEITFKALIRDGHIISGEKGNLQADLLAKPYSKGTANAQSGQMMAMLPMLKIATMSEKGKLVANPNSMILMAAKAQLGL